MAESCPRILKLLLIGDCPEQRAILRQAFSASPYLNVGNELGIDEALSAVSRSASIGPGEKPDLIVLEFPRAAKALESGCELLRAIKAHAGLRGIPVVLIGEVEIFHRLPRSQEAHRCAIVRKPVRPADFRPMAHHFGEYWGAVARVPPRPNTPESRRQQPPASLPRVIGRNDKPGRPLQILLVDDNNDDAVLFQESLASLEMVHLAQVLEDPLAAWDYLLKRGRFREAPTPDLVVLDIHMPQKTGLAFLDDLKAEPALSRLPVVILTASRFEEDIWESYSRGACSFVEKPPRFEWFCELAVRFANYWTGIAYLPDRSE